MDEIFGKIFNAATGVWAIFCTIVVALFKMWPAIMGRFNERRRDLVAEEAADWDRLRAERDRLIALLDVRDAIISARDERIAMLSSEKVELLSRAVTAEAALQGYGEARQRQAIEEAIKRLPPPKDRGDGS